LHGPDEAYPGIKPQFARCMSVAIDGVIFRDGWREPVRKNSEVFLLPRTAEVSSRAVSSVFGTMLPRDPTS